MQNPHEARPESLDIYDVSEPAFSLPRLFRTLGSYRSSIFTATVAVAVVYILGALVFFLLAPVSQVSRLPFRLEWQGADKGNYPNGTKFNIADIVSERVIRQVYDANKLAQYVPYPTFAISMFVEESNSEYNRIAAEYSSRLSDARLTAVDRDRISNEYELKLASISKSGYALTYVCNDATCPPPAVRSKVLSDVLTTWSHSATLEQGVLLYRAPMLSVAIMRGTVNDRRDRLMSLLALRTRVTAVIANVESLSVIPGAELVRTRKDQLSYSEIRLRLQDLLRFRVEPLLEAVATSSSSPQTRQLLAAQLQYDQIQRDSAVSRQRAITESLAAYERDQRQMTETGTAVSSDEGRRSIAPLQNYTPILGDAFIDRVIKLVGDSFGQEYRQHVVDEIKRASLETVPLESAVAYDKHLLDQLGKGGTPVPPEVIDQQWNEIYSGAVTSVEDMSEVYRLISKQLYSETLYSTAGPTSSVSERTVTVKRLLIIGVVVIALMVFIAIVAALIHARLRQDEISEAMEREREHEHEVISI